MNTNLRWSGEPDDASRNLINAICDGTEKDIKNAVMAGGRIMTSDMLLFTLPTANLSENILEYLFAKAMPLKERCLAAITLGQEAAKDEESNMGKVLRDMSVIIVNLLINDEGMVYEKARKNKHMTK